MLTVTFTGMATATAKAAQRKSKRPDTKSNKFGYYKDLRLNKDLRDAYNILAQAAKMYREAQAKAKKAGVRFRVSFERFNEQYAKHNAKTNI